MSSQTPTSITCPRCKNVGEFVTWQSLNVDLNPKEKEKLLSGELTTFTCGKCGHSAEVAYPLLYHDMSRQLMIYLLHRGETQDIDGLEMGKMMKGYRLRRVRSRNELLEKVKIFEAGLDDRALELFKVVLRQDLETSDDEPLFFSGRDPADHDEALLAFVYFPGDQPKSFSVGTDSFRQFAARIDGLVDADPQVDGEWLEVSNAYAIDLFLRASRGKAE